MTCQRTRAHPVALSTPTHSRIHTKRRCTHSHSHSHRVYAHNGKLIISRYTRSLGIADAVYIVHYTALQRRTQSRRHRNESFKFSSIIDIRQRRGGRCYTVLERGRRWGRHDEFQGKLSDNCLVYTCRSLYARGRRRHRHQVMAYNVRRREVGQYVG